jgi:hypothetical protein
MTLGGNHSVIHPTRDERSPDWAGSGEEQKSTTDRECAAQALDVAEPG